MVCLFFFFISHSSYDTHRGRKGTGQWELQMWNFFFKSPLLLLDVWQAVEIQQCNSRRCCEAEAEEAFFFDRDPPVKLSSNSPAQTLPGCITGLVSNGQCDAKPGQGTEHFGWVTLLGNEDFCGEKPQQALPSPQAVNSSVFWRWEQRPHPKISGQPWGEAVATGRLCFLCVLFSFVTKSDLRKKELWGGHGAMVTGGSPATGSKASLWWQIPHFSSETKRREMPNFTHALQKAFFFPLRLPCRSEMPCSNPWMLSDNNCIFNSSWADNPKAELMRGSCFRSSTRLGWRATF